MVTYNALRELLQATAGLIEPRNDPPYPLPPGPRTHREIHSSIQPKPSTSAPLQTKNSLSLTIISIFSSTIRSKYVSISSSSKFSELQHKFSSVVDNDNKQKQCCCAVGRSAPARLDHA